MTQDYFGFSLMGPRNAADNNTTVVYAVNNPADISVIVIYFILVLAVGIWVSYSIVSTERLRALKVICSCESLTALDRAPKPETNVGLFDAGNFQVDS